MKPRIAVLGCGSIGQRHLSNLATRNAGALLAFDPSFDEAPSFAGDADWTASLDEAWQWRPDIVFVAAPTQFHLDYALDAARRGCHLFIEKPLSHSLENVAQLQAEIEKRGLVSMVGCNMRFHPGPRTIHELLSQNLIGQVLSARLQCGSYLPRWRPQSDYRASYSASPVWGGAILDCIHEMDLALWHFGAARLVAALQKPAHVLDLETEGLCEMLLQHQNGVVSSVHLNFVQRDYRRTCQVIGTRGTLFWDFGANCVQHFGEDGQLSGRWSPPQNWEFNQTYQEATTVFLRAVERGEAAPNPVDEAARTLKLALQAREWKSEN